MRVVPLSRSRWPGKTIWKGRAGRSKSELVKEGHPTQNGDLTPAQVAPGSGKKVWWICIREHDGRLHYIIGQVELVVLTSTGNTHALRNLNMVIFFLLCIK
ncbi:hypothetical protein CL673_01980 [Candidatus Bathyarchaeota archaeon]|nr:hypothetical protein [Candidatus Bathyarchaeota archaeon]